MDRKRLCQNLHFNSSLGSSLQQLRWSGRIALPLISDLGVNTHFLRIHMRGEASSRIGSINYDNMYDCMMNEGWICGRWCLPEGNFCLFQTRLESSSSGANIVSGQDRRITDLEMELVGCVEYAGHCELSQENYTSLVNLVQYIWPACIADWAQTCCLNRSSLVEYPLRMEIKVLVVRQLSWQ